MQLVNHILLGVLVAFAGSALALEFKAAHVGQSVVYRPPELHGQYQRGQIDGVTEAAWVPYRHQSITIKTDQGESISIPQDRFGYVWAASGCGVQGACVGQRTYLVRARDCSFGGAYEVNLVARGEAYGDASNFVGEVISGASKDPKTVSGLPATDVREGSCRGSRCVGADVTFDGRAGIETGRLVGLTDGVSCGYGRSATGFFVRMADARLEFTTDCDGGVVGDAVTGGREVWYRNYERTNQIVPVLRGTVIAGDDQWVFLQGGAGKVKRPRYDVAESTGCLRGHTLCVGDQFQPSPAHGKFTIIGFFRRRNEVVVGLDTVFRATTYSVQ